MGCGFEYGSEDIILFQINVTRDCNLRCDHCYIHSDVKASSKFMTREQFLDVASGIARLLEKNPSRKAEIHVVGGEPTMLGQAFYDDVMPEVHRMFDGLGREIILVSNLLRKEARNIAVFFDRVSTSWEPDTRFPKPRLEEIWKANTKDIIADGHDVSCTISMTNTVVHTEPEKILDMLLDIGIRQAHFGFFIPEGDGLVNMNNLFPEFEETSHFLIELTRVWKNTPRFHDMIINPVASMISSLESSKISQDVVCPILTGSLDINWDGNCNSCLEAGGSLNPSYVGNVFRDGVEGVMSSRGFIKEVAWATRPKKPCVTCEYQNICRGACSVLFKHYRHGESTDCPGFKKWISWLDREVVHGS
ncbi:MAG: radical SAM protein [Methanobacteriota archaeon]|nr:MAG: radical SAM protein [Euryarchaeota archaeon]